MPTVALTLDQMREAIALVVEHGTVSAAAEAIDMPRGTFSNRYHRALNAAERGEFGYDPVIPGFRVSQVSTTSNAAGDVTSKSIQQRPTRGEAFENPEGYKLDRISTLVDAEGRVAQEWRKFKANELSLEAVTAHVLHAFTDLSSGHEVIPEPDYARDDLLTLYPLADLHLGLYAWAAESGANWDLSLAVKKYRATMTQVAACSPPSALGVVLIGGDYLHANTNDFRTRTGNVLDGDGRTDKVIDAGVELAVYQIDLALHLHKRVVVRALKGNHDEYASIAIVQGLKGWYRNEPRVTVDSDPDLFWWMLHGKVLLGATHGHTVKVGDMPLIMASRRPADWGASLFRYVHMFHVHHKTQHVFEGGAVVAESHQSPAAQDAYHHGAGYLSGRSMQSITYHKDGGEIIRSSVSILN